MSEGESGRILGRGAATVWLVIAIAILVLSWLVGMIDLRIPETTSAAVLAGLLGALAVILVAFFIVHLFPKPLIASEIFQGIASLVTVFALAIGAGIYFVERHDRPRLAFGIDAQAVTTEKAGREPSTLLLSVRIPVTNTGSQRLIVPCAALDIRGLRPGPEHEREVQFAEEMRLERLPGEIPFAKGHVARCVEAEAERRKVGSDKVRPLYMWEPLKLEPDEKQYLYFEALVSCDYALARVLVKFRLDPESDRSSESKIIVPLSRACRANSEPGEGTSGRLVESGFEAAASDDETDVLPNSMEEAPAEDPPQPSPPGSTISPPQSVP